MGGLLRTTTIAAVAAMGLVAVPVLTSSAANAGSYPSVSIQPSPAPAFDADAPDPDIVLDGSTYYAFTTGTGLGNHLQALIDTTGSPLGGWRSYTGLPFGSSALPVVPAWEQVDTQTSPGVFFWHGRWIMFYDAASAGHPGDTGLQLPVGRDRGLALPRPGLRRPLDRAADLPVGPRWRHRPEPVRRPPDRHSLPGLEVERRGFPRAGPHLVAATGFRRHEPRRGADPADVPGHRELPVGDDDREPQHGRGGWDLLPPVLDRHLGHALLFGDVRHL